MSRLCSHSFRELFRGFGLLLMFANATAWAQQYQSQELAPTQSLEEKKSISALEQEILSNSITDAYARQSTARYLARYYLQASPQKALQFYQESLNGEGLATVAKQQIYLEMIMLQAQLKQHQGILKSMQQRRKLGAKDNPELLMIEANANLALKNFAVIAGIADKAWALKQQAGTLDVSFLEQLRYLYYAAKHYRRATNVQKHIVDKFDQSFAAIKLLSQLYLKQQRYQQAADSLHLAWIKGYPFSSNDILQLSALYAKTQNPYTAAQILQQALQTQRLSASEKHLRQLMYYWLQAKELEFAANSLQQIIEQQPSSADYLLLADLYQRQSQWPAMKASVESACVLNLKDTEVGRANVLLGIAELKLNAPQAARRAFINATLQGGEIDRANQYLAFMQAKAIGQEELQHYQGVCTPGWAKASDFSLTAPSAPADSFFAENVDDIGAFTRIDYKVIDSPTQNLVGRFHTLAINNLEQEILPLAMRLGLFIGKNGGQINGDMHFIFPQPFELGQEFLSFTLAFPVRRQPLLKGHYQVINDENFLAASATFAGHPDKLLQFWSDFYATALSDKLELTGESRQIILEPRKASKSYIKMRLQLGVKEK